MTAVPRSTEDVATGPLLRIENLVVEFTKGRSGRMRALDDVSLDVSPGEILGVVGESGSGKTTLGRTVAGFQQPTSGSVLLRDPRGALTPRTGVHGHRDVQMIFQESAAALNPRMSVERILREAFDPRPGPARRTSRTRLAPRIHAALRGVELPESHAGKRSSELSGGEKQRVSIARALAARPPLIVCDEAVSALDVAVRAITLNLLARLRAETGVALLFISHDISVVGHLADRIVVMHRGRVVETGPVDTVLDNPQDAYTQRLISSVPKLELES